MFTSLFSEKGTVFFSNCSDGEVRLIGGANEYEGRVEVCINGAWGTVCYSTSSYYYSNYWEVTDARVVCRQLGHQELGKYYSILLYIFSNQPFASANTSKKSMHNLSNSLYCIPSSHIVDSHIHSIHMINDKCMHT